MPGGIVRPFTIRPFLAGPLHEESAKRFVLAFPFSLAVAASSPTAPFVGRTNSGCPDLPTQNAEVVLTVLVLQPGLYAPLEGAA
jgi:hypothetical protein